jgi:hypothetical protein
MRKQKISKKFWCDVVIRGAMDRYFEEERPHADPAHRN